MNRTVLLIVGVAALAAVIAVAAITLGGGDDAPEFGKGSYEEIEQAVNRAGLDLVSDGVSDADITGGYEEKTYTASTKSNASDGLMIVRAFSGPDQIDAIKEDTYVGDSALGYRWQQYTISLTASSPPEVIELFRDGMANLDGAKEIYDHL